MKKILVPFDFSAPAVNAYRFALNTAAKAKGEVHLLHVIELPAMPNTALAPVRSMEESLMKEMRQKVQTKFEKIAARYQVKGVKFLIKLEFGVPAKTILKYASRHSMDLIVMGSHGAHGIREYVIGSNAEKIVRTSPVPVLIVKDYFKLPIRNIVFPNTLDTENQEDLIRKVKALQHFFKAHLHIVYINTPVNFTSDTLTVERLHAFTKRFAFKDFTVSIFNHWYEDQGIIQFTHAIKADLIVMGTHGRKGLSHLVSGSMAEDVVNHVNALIWTCVLKKGRNK